MCYLMQQTGHFNISSLKNKNKNALYCVHLLLTQCFHARWFSGMWPEPGGVAGSWGGSIVAWGRGVGLQSWGGGLVVLRDEGMEMELTELKLHTTNAQIQRARSH